MSNKKLDRLIAMTSKDYEFLLAELKRIKKISLSEKEGTEVRLCIDIDDSESSWIIRYGSVDYDQRHSAFCGASSVSKHTNIQAVLEDLINQCADQAAERE